MKPNNKKKYVRKEQVVALRESRSSSRLDTSMKQSRLSVADFDEGQDTRAKEFDLGLNDKQILHLWLVQILPGKYSKFRLDIVKKKIKGQQVQCQKKLNECKQHLELFVLKMISAQEEKIVGNFKAVMEVKFDLKIFDKRIIKAACDEIRRDYQYDAIMDIIKNFKSTYYYLVSITKGQADFFINWFEENKDEEMTKQDIQMAKEMKGKKLKRIQSIKTTSVTKPQALTKVQKEKAPPRNRDDDEQQQSSIQEESDDSSEQQNNFYSYQQKNQAQGTNKQPLNTNTTESSKIQNKKQDDAQNQKNQGKKKYVPKNFRKNYANQQCNLVRKPEQHRYRVIFNKIYDENIFDLDAFKKWVKNNKIVKIEEFQFEKKDKKIHVILKAIQDLQAKQDSMKIYIQYTKVIIMQQLSNQNKKRVEQKFCADNQEYLTCEIVQGFMEPNTHQHKLRTLIMQGRTNKTYRNTKKFCALLLKGLSPLVQKTQVQAKAFIDQLPKNNKIQNVILDLPKIQPYLAEDNEDRIKVLIQKIFNNKLTQYTEFKLVNVNFPHNKIALKLDIKYECYDEFMERGKQKLDKQLAQCINITELVNEEQITKDLQKEYMLFRSVQNSKMYVLITESKNAVQQTKKIMNIVSKSNNELQQYEISFKKGRLQQLKNYIDEIKVNPALKDVMAKVKFSFEKQNKLLIIGTTKNTQTISQAINKYLSKIDDSIVVKTFFVTDAEAVVVEKNTNRFSEQINKAFKLNFNLSKDIDLGAVFSIGNSKDLNMQSPLVVMVQKHKNLDRLPNQTAIYFQAQNDFNFFTDKAFNQIKAFFFNKNKNDITIKNDSQRDYFYLYTQRFTNSDHMAKQLIKLYPYQNPLNKKTFAFVMPKNDKSKFVLSILQSFENIIKTEQMKIKIFIFQEPGSDLKKQLLPIEETYNRVDIQYRYYVFDKKQFYYSKQGDEKINDALKRGKNCVYLTNQDLNMEIKTHQYYANQRKLVHMQSGKSTALQVFGNKFIYAVKNIQFELPASQANLIISNKDPNTPIQLSIGAYELDFKTMIQTNLFSGFTRNILKKEISQTRKNTGKLIASFDQKVNQIEIAYEHKQESNAIKACQKLKSLIQAERISVDYKLQKPLKKETFQKLRVMASDLDVNLVESGEKQLKLSSFQKVNINTFSKSIEFYVNQVEKKQVKYPTTWVQQKSEIQTFVVPANSTQFKQIQAKFRIANIKQLLRIQNSLVYKKYVDQKNFLTNLNKKQVKQMFLFHGTRTTDPKMIYQDKEECFNINYTSDNNYLGRGTYFAQLPQYSHNYAYISKGSGIMNNLFGGQTYEMFYCSVLVGDSQVVPAVTSQSRSMKDTGYKNAAQKIRYQTSTMFTNGSNIYTVYKNRRAYPHYLIRY